MALYCLDQLGATNEQILSFNDHYIKKLEPIDKEPIEIKDPFEHLGREDSFFSLVLYFEKELNAKGIKKALKDFLPLAFPGVSGAAFHPLIRLAFSIKIQNITEIAHSLASWITSFQTLDGHEKANSILSLEESLTDLKEKFSESEFRPTGYGVFHRMKEASKHSNFSTFLSCFKSSPDSLLEIRELVLRLYLSSNDNFTALHAVTSAHAYRVLEDYLEEKIIDGYGYYWQAIGAAYIDIGLPEIENQPIPKNLPSWEMIQKKAASSLNDHLIKLVFTCLDEFNSSKDPLYHYTAAKKVQLI